jgi:hypothetical protein
MVELNIKYGSKPISAVHLAERYFTSFLEVPERAQAGHQLRSMS